MDLRHMRYRITLQLQLVVEIVTIRQDKVNVRTKQYVRFVADLLALLLLEFLA